MGNSPLDFNQLIVGVLNNVIGPQQSLIKGLEQLGAKSAEHWPQVEKEILKFHAGILRNCLDIVTNSLQALETPPSAPKPPANPASAEAVPPSA
jgi:hypothetical protein